MIFPFLILLHGAVAAYLLLSGKPAELAPLTRSGLALLSLSPVILYWLWPKRLKVATARCRQRAGWLDRLAVLAVAMTIGCSFFWLLSAAPEPLETLSLTLEQQLRPQVAVARQAAAMRNAPPREGTGLWDDNGRRTLPKRANFKPGSQRPEVFLRVHDAGDVTELLQGPIYVSAASSSRYERAAWHFEPKLKETLLADAAGFVQLGNRAGRAIAHEVFHSSNDNGQNVLIALQGVLTAKVPQLTRLGEGTYLLPPPLNPPFYEYLASSAPLRLEDLPEGIEIAPWPRSPAVLTALPEAGNLTTKLRNLAKLAAGTGTTPQRLLNLRNHLRTTLKYALETTNASGLDPMDNFLFVEMSGHCEYFATAGALLARALGVPARITYGWTGGTCYESRGEFVFRASEAHAWTEVCLEGYGWVVMDPTPPAAIRGEQPRVARPDEKPPAINATYDDTPEPAAAPAASPARVGWWLTSGLMLPALGLLVWRGIRHRRAAEGAPDARETVLGTPHYLSVWRRAAARRGLPMPAGMTLRRHLAQLPLALPVAAELLEYHYGIRYRGDRPDPRIEKQLTAAIRRWESDSGGKAD
jgi:transglutaminase-like putative cysteine protease